jgi:hypothetical protein
MSSFVIARNYGQNPAPGRVSVKLDAAVNAELGFMLVTVAGYGRIPAAANAATGKMAGLVVQPADNSAGIQGALSVIVDVFTADFAADGTHPPTQADVGKLVYASSATTISNNTADGPPAGKLIAFVTGDPQGRPCRVALDCMATS